MNYSNKQLNDLETIAYFTGNSVADFSRDEIESYFQWSEKGKGNGGRLAVMKQVRGIMMGEYEKGILMGYVPYYTLLGGENKTEVPPRLAVDFMKKELFKGIDAELIERVYQEILAT